MAPHHHVLGVDLAVETARRIGVPREGPVESFFHDLGRHSSCRRRRCCIDTASRASRHLASDCARSSTASRWCLSSRRGSAASADRRVLLRTHLDRLLANWAARDHQITMRRDLSKKLPVAIAGVEARAVRPQQNRQLLRPKLRQVALVVDDLPGQALFLGHDRFVGTGAQRNIGLEVGRHAEGQRQPSTVELRSRRWHLRCDGRERRDDRKQHDNIEPTNLEHRSLLIYFGNGRGVTSASLRPRLHFSASKYM